MVNEKSKLLLFTFIWRWASACFHYYSFFFFVACFAPVSMLYWKLDKAAAAIIDGARLTLGKCANLRNAKESVEARG